MASGLNAIGSPPAKDYECHRKFDLKVMVLQASIWVLGHASIYRYMRR